MRTKLQKKVLVIVMFFGVAAMLSRVARATDCTRYIRFDGTTTYIAPSCAEQLEITPIFMSGPYDTGDYDIIVPPMYNTGSTYRRLPAAAGQWLSTGENLDVTEAAIEAAIGHSGMYPVISTPTSVSRTEHLNYSLSAWLDMSGATASITSLSNNSNLSVNDPNSPDGMCQHIPVCTSCQWYHCTYDEWWNIDGCFCAAWGIDCCVIHKVFQPRID